MHVLLKETGRSIYGNWMVWIRKLDGWFSFAWLDMAWLGLAWHGLAWLGLASLTLVWLGVDPLGLA